MRFTYSSYTKLIEQLNCNDYKTCSYHDYYNWDKCVILRHDVDNSLQKAWEMAKVENDIGIRSTYFIMLSTDFYNIASKRSLDIICEIHGLGHEIGLHFDEVKYAPCTNSEMIGYIENELNIMSMLLGWDIQSVSMHRPSETTLNADLKLRGHHVNSYSKEFFQGFKYVSDSRRIWREDVEAIISSGAHKKLHILTHPFWYNIEEKTLEQSVEEFINIANEERYRSVKDNIRDLDEIMESSEVSR